MRDAVVFAEAAVPADGHDARVEHACLAIKATAAERVGTRALRRLTGAGATRARPLGDRIRRHALAADAALERAAAALISIVADAGFAEAYPQFGKLMRTRLLRFGVPSAR